VSQPRSSHEQKQARRLARVAHRIQNGHCYWCGEKMALVSNGGMSPRLMTAEHLKPVWAGGSAVPGNIVAACNECNNKRDRKYTERRNRGMLSFGDDGPRSPFEVLRGQLIDNRRKRRRREMKWLMRAER
jgi:5-methylcytosine-specific restriction endonuclease McrA